MRDNIHLSANIYKPKDETAGPAILAITPYIADSMHERGMFFAQHGYVYVAVDSRGRGNSEGEFDGFESGTDGYDVVEWIAEQSWCDGNVAMRGASYLGGIQWTTLKEFPPHLKSIVPGAATYAGMVTPLMKNIFIGEEFQWWVSVIGKAANDNIGEDESFWKGIYNELEANHLPFSQLDKIAGFQSDFFKTVLEHPAYDSFYSDKNFSNDDYKKIDIPILTISGHYDDTQTAAIKHYKMHMEHGLPEGQHKHYLLLGPWDHGGVSTPALEVGGLKFDKKSKLDLNELHKQWYDWTLKNDPKPEFLKKRISYYVMGAEEWKYADRFDDIPARPEKLYLNSSNGKANDVFNSGMLQADKPGESMPDNYIYNPLDNHIDPSRSQTGAYLKDQRFVLSLKNNGLIYHSPVFEQEKEITGFVKAKLWISMNVSDTDFQVVLFEVLADGTQIRLAQDFLRARYRESNSCETLVKPNEINSYVFDEFPFFSRQIARGSRLRILISNPGTWYFEKNYNSGGVVARESGKDARTAKITLHHDARHPSYLQIPMIPIV